jgi:hypothetical protein
MRSVRVVAAKVKRRTRDTRAGQMQLGGEGRSDPLRLPCSEGSCRVVTMETVRVQLWFLSQVVSINTKHQRAIPPTISIFASAPIGL